MPDPPERAGSSPELAQHCCCLFHTRAVPSVAHARVQPDRCACRSHWSAAVTGLSLRHSGALSEWRAAVDHLLRSADLAERHLRVCLALDLFLACYQCLVSNWTLALISLRVSQPVRSPLRRRWRPSTQTPRMAWGDMA